MKNIYKILAIVLFSLTTTLNAQFKNVDGTTNDEFLGSNGTVLGKSCNCVNEDIADFNFTFSSDFYYALANDQAVIEAAKQEAWDWYNRQTDILKNYIGSKYNKTFNSYNEAKEYLFKETEKKYIRNNAPSAKQKISSSYYSANNAEKVGLKGLKALSHRENEINRGNLDNSLYADFKVNGTPLKDIRTISELNSIRAIVNNSTIDGLWQSDQFYSMLNNINAMISSSAYSELETLAFNKKNNFYNGYNPWDRLNMMQLQIYFQEHNNYVSYPHFLPGGVFENFNNKIQIATPSFIETEVQKNYTEFGLFHNEHWRIILRDKYNNSPFYNAIAKAEHQALMNAELNRLKNLTSMGASLNVDKIVRQFNITDPNEYEWLNANPDKADEYLQRLREAQALDNQENSEPIPDNQIISIVGNNYESEIAKINNELAEGARIAKLIDELNIINEQKDWMLTHFEQAIEIVNFADHKRIDDVIPDEILSFIIESINTLQLGGEVNLEEQVILSKSLPDCVKKIIKKMMSDNAHVYLSDMPDFVKEELNLSGQIFDVFNNSDRYHINYIVADLSPNSQGLERNASTKYNLSTKAFDITLNTSYVSNSTDLAIARTIIHESLHAYISYVYHSQPFSDLRESLSTLLSQNGNDQNTAEHILMTKNFINSIASSLESWDNSSLQDDNYYLYLSWSGGLLNTTAFNSLPSETKQKIIEANKNEGQAGENGEATDDALGTKNCN